MPPQVNQSSNIPPPPPGYQLDGVPPPPPGYTLDAHGSPVQPPADLGPTPSQIPPPSAYVQGFKDLGKGFVKSAGQTLTLPMLSQKVRNAVSPFMGGAATAGESVNGIGDTPERVTPEQVNAVRQSLTPQGAVQNIGAAGEQAAEMMATGGPLKAAATGLASKLPFLGRFMGPGARVAAEAANTAGNASMHGQDPNAAALAGTGGATINELLPFLSAALKKGAQSQYIQALAPTKETNKALAAKVAPGLIDRGMVGSVPGIAVKAGKNMATAGQAVQAAENALPQGATNDISSVVGKLDQMKSKYSVGGSVPVSRQGTVDYIDQLKNDIISRSQGGQMPTSDLIQFRRLLDEPIGQAGGYAGKDMLGNKKIDKAAADSMRSILNSNNPDLATANASYSFWKNVRNVASATAQRQTGQQGGLKAMLTGMGVAGGLQHGGMNMHGAQDAAIGAGAMYVLGHVMRSAEWRTASAVVKNRIADALATDNADAFVRALSDFSAASASQLTSPQVQQ